MAIKNRGKKIKKRGLLTIGILFTICIVIVAVFFLFGQNSEEKKQYEAQIKQESEEFTDELISELNQIDTSDAGMDKAATANDTIPLTEAPAGIITEAEKQVITEELAKLEDTRKQQVLQTLSVAYSKALDEQKQEAYSMVENLIAQGKADWTALAAKGENNTVNKGKLASEYLAKSKVIEAQMDASFASLAQKMEEQLKAEGIDPTAIIAQYQAEYETIKQGNKQSLMKKVMDAVRN